MPHRVPHLQKSAYKLAENMDRLIPDGSRLTNKINGIDADVSGVSPDARLCALTFATEVPAIDTGIGMWRAMLAAAPEQEMLTRRPPDQDTSDQCDAD